MLYDITKFFTILVINIIYKNSSIFNWYKIINFDKYDYHKEVTKMCSDTAVFAQTSNKCCVVLHIIEYSANNGSLEDAPGTTVSLVQEGDQMKLAQK
jgi:hypothetical protein